MEDFVNNITGQVTILINAVVTAALVAVKLFKTIWRK